LFYKVRTIDVNPYGVKTYDQIGTAFVVTPYVATTYVKKKPQD